MSEHCLSVSIKKQWNSYAPLTMIQNVIIKILLQILRKMMYASEDNALGE